MSSRRTESRSSSILDGFDWDRVCDLCKYAQNASWKCLNCSDVMCETCAAIHRNGKLTRWHLIIMQRNKEEEERLLKTIRCEVHPSENNEMFCAKCNTPICNTCIMREHELHPLLPFEVKAEQEKGKLRSLLDDEVKKKLKLLADWIGQQSQIEADFRQRNEKMLESVDGRIHEICLVVKSIKTNVEKQNASRMKEILKNAETMRNLSQSIQEAIIEVEEALKKASPLEMIRKSEEFRDRLIPKIPEVVKPALLEMTRSRLDTNILSSVRKECNSRGSEVEFGNLIKKNAQLQRKMDEMTEEYEKSMEVLKEKYKAVFESKTYLDHEVDVLRTENLRLEQEKDQLTLERDALQQSASTMQREINVLQMQVDFYSRKSTTEHPAVYRCKDLEKEVEQLRAENERITLKNAQSLAKLKTELAVLKRQPQFSTSNQRGCEGQRPSTHPGIKREAYSGRLWKSFQGIDDAQTTTSSSTQSRSTSSRYPRLLHAAIPCGHGTLGMWNTRQHGQSSTLSASTKS